MLFVVLCCYYYYYHHSHHYHHHCANVKNMSYVSHVVNCRPCEIETVVTTALVLFVTSSDNVKRLSITRLSECYCGA